MTQEERVLAEREAVREKLRDMECMIVNEKQTEIWCACSKSERVSVFDFFLASHQQNNEEWRQQWQKERPKEEGKEARP